MVAAAAAGIVRLLVALGLPVAAARVAGILLEEDRPLSLDELSRRTGYAKSHVHAMLRLLESRLVVRRHYAGRRILYSTDPRGIERLIMNHIRELLEALEEADERVRERLGRVVHMLKRIEEEAGGP